MFLGHQSTRVDEKGRLKLSTEYKAQIDESFGPKFYITSMDGKRAQLYPLQEWMKKLELLNALPASNAIRQRILDVTSRYGHQVDMDNQGRLLLPQELREEAKLMGDVVVVSKGTILEVVNGPEFRAQAAPLTAEEMMQAAQLGL
jgi:MraZ protein